MRLRAQKLSPRVIAKQIGGEEFGLFLSGAGPT